MRKINRNANEFILFDFMFYKNYKGDNMLKYIIRLDDACPNMNKANWDRIEQLLDKYSIKPIVGIIPDCKDKEFEQYKYINNFWNEYAREYQKKGWIIAQHGLNHNLSKSVRTEFSNKSYEEQYRIIKEGYDILREKGITPISFFAPNHTFDDNTIKVCKDLDVFKFISDGYSLYPYKYKDVLFLPSVFDTPHKVSPLGVWTFVYHPNNMSDNDFTYLEEFIKRYKENFEIDINEIIKKYENRKRKPHDWILKFMIMLLRKVKGNYEK